MSSMWSIESIDGSDGRTYSRTFAGCGKYGASYQRTSIYDASVSDCDAIRRCASEATSSDGSFRIFLNAVDYNPPQWHCDFSSDSFDGPYQDYPGIRGFYNYVANAAITTSSTAAPSIEPVLTTTTEVISSSFTSTTSLSSDLPPFFSTSPTQLTVTTSQSFTLPEPGTTTESYTTSESTITSMSPSATIDLTSETTSDSSTEAMTSASFTTFSTGELSSTVSESTTTSFYTSITIDSTLQSTTSFSTESTTDLSLTSSSTSDPSSLTSESSTTSLSPSITIDPALQSTSASSTESTTSFLSISSSTGESSCAASCGSSSSTTASTGDSSTTSGSSSLATTQSTTSSVPSTFATSVSSSTSSSSRTSSTTSAASCPTKTNILSNKGFETFNPNNGRSPPWTSSVSSGSISVSNVEYTDRNPTHTGRRQILVRSKASAETAKISQQVNVCPGIAYTFSAWVRRPSKKAQCVVSFNLGSQFLGATMTGISSTAYEHIQLFVAPSTAAQQKLTISVTCYGDADKNGNRDLYLDDISLKTR
ncbi:uncharacterized protein AB675_9457 [Cyphellophora attinorum]|uniref:CBM-cenC domain-containing protein n=1 Tax=Cyphellophora attinorum TaxID=1664694 RepID=A0A0N0NPA4_9EURO|nr:uncharacterized protein AB675_9457 [Phialophora attinorum]KPI42309.1 hypothetical protein AB675_9457 [Phialophora attinorum]